MSFASAATRDETDYMDGKGPCFKADFPKVISELIENYIML